MARPTTGEIWLRKVNACLAAPVIAQSLEDEIAYDCYVAGKSARQTADEITAYRSGKLQRA